MDEWAVPIAQASAATACDPFAPLLADRLAAISRCGLDASRLLGRAASAGPLPDDHAAAALWWRINRHLSPAVAEKVHHDHAITTAWTPRLPQLLGTEKAQALRASPSWPALVATIDQAIQRGWTLENLLGGARSPETDPADPGADQCQALIWRLSVALDPIPDQYDHDDPHTATEAIWAELEIPPDAPETLLNPADPDLALPADQDASVIGAHPAGFGTDASPQIASRLPINTTTHCRDLLPAVESGSADPRTLAPDQPDKVNEACARIQQAARPASERWASLGSELDPRLPHEGDWPALAALLDRANNDGHDVSTLANRLVTGRALGDAPAQDLRYRLVAALDMQFDAEGPRSPARPAAAAAQERWSARAATRRPNGPRR
jgi:hypothetical protein